MDLNQPCPAEVQVGGIDARGCSDKSELIDLALAAFDSSGGGIAAESRFLHFFGGADGSGVVELARRCIGRSAAAAV